MPDSFARLHPIVTMYFFAAVILFGMFFMHPVFQGIALLSAFAYSTMIKGKRGFKFNVFYLLPLLLFMAVLNPAFNHQGVTILFYLQSGNPVTLESILYGAAAAVMFVTVILWFSCYNAVMTSDKFIYLFGRAMPALSLILSMVLRFVPRYIEQIKAIANVQKSIGRDASQGHIARRARNGLKILSIMTTWALENAVETADSMKSRGYGLPGRTSYSLYRFDKRDKAVLTVLIAMSLVVMVGAVRGENTIRFFPSIKHAEVTVVSVVVYAAYLTLCMTPVLLNIREAMKWKRIESRM
ncbi:energy-coupling factor transporter transmembrane protein EcfT [Xylanibacillus composti]|uniref:Cobalt transporter n=1 Tax=Xylanibacillus composti TaxID=1572762 RepID=A0A8J4H816_9BACL|nr:energy-coupling factor transporter transmembrane component T [Xylanibacillus composti]MDT9726311.1 energy-coupling factor transporter transmembrane protein EcfT [Xylanibacillus composti]GIQ70583.1 cobalt transporter [Xylanibacillus composti]